MSSFIGKQFPREFLLLWQLRDLFLTSVKAIPFDPDDDGRLLWNTIKSVVNFLFQRGSNSFFPQWISPSLIKHVRVFPSLCARSFLLFRSHLLMHGFGGSMIYILF